MSNQETFRPALSANEFLTVFQSLLSLSRYAIFSLSTNIEPALAHTYTHAAIILDVFSKKSNILSYMRFRYRDCEEVR